MGYAVLFPGQGSQFVGMGEELFQRRDDLLGPAADDVLGWSLADVCLNGPEEELTRTDRAQPALYGIAYALWTELAARISDPAAGAGHSLGEYTAHAAAGTFEYLDGLRLVAARGEAMASAAAAEASGMAALLGADTEAAESAVGARRAAGGSLWVANLNGPGQVVVAGGSDDLAWLSEHAPTFGIRRVVPLRVAGGFHSPFMEPAVALLRSALKDTAISNSRFPVWANSAAAPVAHSDVAESLATQVTSPVRFGETLAGMSTGGIDVFVHVGPGEVTAGLARRALPDAEVLVVNDLESIGRAVERLG